MKAYRYVDGAWQGSMELEVQQRACEYTRILGHDNIRSGLLEQMPPLTDDSDPSVSALDPPATQQVRFRLSLYPGSR